MRVCTIGKISNGQLSDHTLLNQPPFPRINRERDFREIHDVLAATPVAPSAKVTSQPSNIVGDPHRNCRG